MPAKKRLTRIFIYSAAGVLAVLAAVGMLLKEKPPEPVPAGPVVIEASQAPAPEIVDVMPAAPSPDVAEALPAGASTLLVDRAPVLTLASEDALRELLAEYLAAAAVAPEGERLVSAEFACELICAPAAEDAHLTAYEDALALLSNAPGTVPVRLVTEKRTETTAVIETSTTNDALLAKGSRIIKQLGFAERTRTTAQLVYVGGAPARENAPMQTETIEGRTQLISVGTWSSKGDTPGKDLGKRSKDPGELKLSHPMRGSVNSYFGMRGGNMHNGLDIAAKAGTRVSAPGEGVVVYCGERGAYGYVIDIDHGAGFVSRLTHIDPDSVQVEYNQRVFSGDPVGTLAAASGGKPHLHYELLIDSIPHNPLLYIG